MWKYINTGAAVLFLAGTFFFYKSHEAMTTPATGEVAAVQTQFDNAIRKSKDIHLDKAIKQYAVLRTAFFNQETERFDQERTAIEEQDAPLPAEIQRKQEELDQAKEEYNKLQEDFNKLKRETREMLSLEDVDDDSLRDVGEAIAELKNHNDKTEAEVAKELSITETLGKASTRTIAGTRAAKRLHADRLARLSPAELRCAVISADPKWDYVILDAGIDKGIVIGSRLVVMRGDRKICELDVTLVESNRSSCDIIYSTIRPGDRVLPGDHVYAVREDK